MLSQLSSAANASAHGEEVMSPLSPAPLVADLGGLFGVRPGEWLTSSATLSFLSFSSFDDQESSDSRSRAGSLRVKNTFIHVDREAVDSDDELDMPLKCVSAPNIETYHESSPLRSSASLPLQTYARESSVTVSQNEPKPDMARTPKVTFDLAPSFFGGILGENQTRPPTPLNSESKASPAKVCVESLSSGICRPGGEESPTSMAVKPIKVVSTSSQPSQLAGPPHVRLPPGLKLDDSVSSGFRIKNTFIHVDLDADNADLDACTFVSSARRVSRRRTWQPEPQHGQESSHLPIPVEIEACRPVALPSVGAALHSSGQCKPCAWFWKAESCQWGAECQHCHMCPEGELRRRKREKQAQSKEQRVALRAS